ncbi:uncharacterized protein LOC133552366 [Nerophis ophidion]|uniref:uncharacterized protein LOC133552366 n=1 Tax=Nerophis ophidion TaxID=159077 RepID=UPI002ADF2B57|nr:uncharacterized protein LOC133552366 [Nerophis ophidion]XP_061755562.1 uncharacterized protein LOC133552366 [Nerophis ophidion]
MSTSTPLEALGQVLAEVSAASQQQTELIQRLMDRALVGAGAKAAMQRMGEAEDPHTFLDIFEATATSCRWPELEEWGVKLLPLLVGEAQRVALSLPAAARMQYANLRHAILDRVGSSPEDHKRKFRAMRLGQEDRPFVLAQQLRDAATRGLQPNGQDPKVVEKILLERFIDAIPPWTAAWVRYHRPADVKAAVTLAEDHLAVQREATKKTAERPIPAPCRRLTPPDGMALEPRPHLAGGSGSMEQVPSSNDQHKSTYTHTQSHTHTHPKRGGNCLSACPFQGTGALQRGLPSQMAPQTPGQECWGCGQPGHVRPECSLMEVGQVMRVVGDPAPASIRGRRTVSRLSSTYAKAKKDGRFCCILVDFLRPLINLPNKYSHDVMSWRDAGNKNNSAHVQHESIAKGLRPGQTL